MAGPGVDQHVADLARPVRLFQHGHVSDEEPQEDVTRPGFEDEEGPDERVRGGDVAEPERQERGRAHVEQRTEAQRPGFPV